MKEFTKASVSTIITTHNRRIEGLMRSLRQHILTAEEVGEMVREVVKIKAELTLLYQLRGE